MFLLLFIGIAFGVPLCRSKCDINLLSLFKELHFHLPHFCPLLLIFLLFFSVFNNSFLFLVSSYFSYHKEHLQRRVWWEGTYSSLVSTGWLPAIFEYLILLLRSIQSNGIVPPDRAMVELISVKET